MRDQRQAESVPDGRYRKYTRLQRVLSVISFLCFACLLLYLLVISILAYIEKSPSTYRTYQTPHSIPFPTVKICNNYPVRRSAAYPHLKQLFDKWSEDRMKRSAVVDCGGVTNDFKMVADKAINGYNTEEINGINLTTCRNHCFDRVWCRSFDYLTDTRCLLSVANANDDGVLLKYLAGYVYGHRCYNESTTVAPPSDSTEVVSLSTDPVEGTTSAGVLSQSTLPPETDTATVENTAAPDVTTIPDDGGGDGGDPETYTVIVTRPNLPDIDWDDFDSNHNNSDAENATMEPFGNGTNAAREHRIKQLVEAIAQFSAEEKKEMGYSIDMMLLNCTYNGRQCNQSWNESMFDPRHGLCYIYDIARKERVQDETLPHHREGLVLSLFTADNETIEGLGLDPGFVVAINHPTPHIALSPHYFVPVQQHTTIGVQAVISNQSFDCNGTQGYNKRVCGTECLSEEISSKCDCTDPWLSAAQHSNITCSPDHSVQENCRLAEHARFSSNESCTHCQDPCSSVTYRDTVNTYAIQDLDEKFWDDYPLTKLQVYLNSYQVEQLVHNRYYTLLELLCDVVGMCSFFVLLCLLDPVGSLCHLVLPRRSLSPPPMPQQHIELHDILHRSTSCDSLKQQPPPCSPTPHPHSLADISIQSGGPNSIDVLDTDSSTDLVAGSSNKHTHSRGTLYHMSKQRLSEITVSSANLSRSSAGSNAQRQEPSTSTQSVRNRKGSKQKLDS